MLHLLPMVLLMVQFYLFDVNDSNTPIWTYDAGIIGIFGKSLICPDGEYVVVGTAGAE